MSRYPDAKDPSNWLHAYLRMAVETGMCVKTICTTCSTGPFRHGLLERLAASRGVMPERRLNRETAIVLAQVLADVQPAWDEEFRLDEGARFVILYIWGALFGLPRDAEMERLLSDSWAGGVYRRMQAHHQRRLEAQRRHEEMNDPARLALYRAEKQRQRDEEQAARQARKLERDRAWLQRQGVTSDD